MPPRPKKQKPQPQAEAYRHPESESLMRPEVGTQARRLFDTDYNGRDFPVRQAFFPRTPASDNLKKALKGTYEQGVWDYHAPATSVPFEAGEHKQVAVKVIDDRGNELLVVKALPAKRKGK
jgi:hypothetical protein